MSYCTKFRFIERCKRIKKRKINFYFLTVVRHDHLSFHFGTVGQNALDFSLSRLIYIRVFRLHSRKEDQEGKWIRKGICLIIYPSKAMSVFFVLVIMPQVYSLV